MAIIIVITRGVTKVIVTLRYNRAHWCSQATLLRVCSLDWYQCAYKIWCKMTDWAVLMSVWKMELPVHCVSGSCEIHSVIRFLAAEGVPTPAIHTCLKNVYGDSVMPLRTVPSWVRKFKEEKRENVHNEERSGHPNEASTEETRCAVLHILDICGYSRHTEEEDQAETCGIIASQSHFTTKQRYAAHVANGQEENWGLPEGSFHASGEFTRYRIFGLPPLPSSKEIFGRKRFANDEELKMTICQWMKDVGAQFYTDGINKLVHRYEICGQMGDDYVEK